MPIYRLTPLDRQVAEWGLSAVRGELIVRALNEHHARQIAANFCAFGTAYTLDASPPVTPWGDADLVSVERINGDRWPEDGVSHVLKFSTLLGDENGAWQSLGA